MRKGGHVLLADDFGKADRLFAAFNVIRKPIDSHGLRKLYEGRRNLPLAEPARTHPLTKGVEELVTNHPAAFFPAHGHETIFALTDGQPIAIAGTLGQGRFVALSDPSVLINCMLAFPGNANFATNLLDYLGDAGARLFVLRSEAELYGVPRPGAERPVSKLVHDLDGFILELNEYLAPVETLRTMGIVGAALIALLFLVILPLLRSQSPVHAFVRILGSAHRRPSDLFTALLLRESIEKRVAVLTGANLDDPNVTRILAQRFGPESSRAFRKLYRAMKCRNFDEKRLRVITKAATKFERTLSAG